MLNKKLFFLSLLVAALLFTSCKWFQKVGSSPKVSFNISEADALGGRDLNTDGSASGSRAADHSKGSALVKIMQDGSLESAVSFTLPDTSNLSDKNRAKKPKYGKLTDVFLPPKESGCKDVYLLFDFPTYFITEDPKEPGHGTHWGLSSFICIHEDNTWTDLLYDSPWGVTVFNITSKKNIQIAPDGTLYVLYNEGDWHFFIKKYDPATKTVSELCSFGRSSPLVEETDNWTLEQWESNQISVNRMELSKDLKWAYIQIQKNDKQYIHVASIENPKNYTDIVLDNCRDICRWDYEEKSNKLYYLETIRNPDYSEKELNIYKIDADGKSNKELFKKLELSQACEALHAVAEDTVWARYNSNETSGINTIVLEDLKTNKVVAKIPLKPAGTNYSCEQDYITTDDAVYFRYSADFDDHLYLNKTNEIFRVSISDGSVINYTDMLEEKNNIAITNWNVGDSKLYIVGIVNDEPVNYEINLDGTGIPKKVAEGQVLTCIGSLR